MIQTKTLLSVKIGERVYELYLSPDSPLGEVHDALQQMKGYVIQKLIEEHNKVLSQEPSEDKA